MFDRDERIIEHIADYRLSLRVVLERLFFDGKSCDNVMQRLLKQGRIQALKGLPGKLSYYQLSEAETKRRGLPIELSKVMDNAALSRNLAILWFCTMEPIRRYRLTKEELQQVLSGLPGDHRRAHCLEQRADSSWRLYRVYVPGPNSKDADMYKIIRDELTALHAQQECADWLTKTQKYKVAILAQTQSRKETIVQAIRRSDLRDFANFLVEVAPGPDELKEAINAVTNEEQRS